MKTVRIPTRWPGFIVATIFLGGILVAAWFFFVTQAFTTVRTEYVYRTRAASVSSTKQLEEALGKPDTSMAGEQINPQLQGATCELWQRKADLVIVCHA